MRSHWQFFIGQSSDLTRIADVTHEFENPSLTLGMNRSGSLEGEFALSSDWKNYLVPVKNCLIATKNDNTIYSGPIWTRNDSFADAKISISSVGWFEILRKRVLEAQKVYTNLRRGAIIKDLVATTNVLHNSWVSPSGVDTDTTSSAIPSRTYERFTNIGDTIIQLTEEESGPEISIDPDTRALNITAWDDFQDQTDVQFGFNWGPSNLSSFEESVDASEMRNRIWVTGSSIWGHADDTDAQTEYQLFHDVISISNSNDVELLGAIANAEIVVNAYPRVLYSFTPKPENTGENVPRIFEDYSIGDQIYITAKRNGKEIIKQAVRLFGVTLNIDSNGNEIITNMQVTYQSG